MTAMGTSGVREGGGSRGADRERRVRRLFEAASQEQDAARALILDAARVDDPEVCADVEALLGYHEQSGHLLDGSALEAASALTGGEPVGSGADAVPPAPPAVIGRFRIIREIGRGGMGVVYEAEQEFPRRRVALKVVRPELVTSSLLKRFSHEAEALASLQHPGIAQLFEAGFADQEWGGEARRRPYIAMELVEGRPLTVFTREGGGGGGGGGGGLSIAERFELVARACDAVDHAHRRGVIHRDLKPANILVNERGEPKVLDFGVARLTGADAPDHAMTSAGQIIGTLGYMSPEQVAGDQRAVDSRSDVYALVAILYDALAERSPVDVAGMSVTQAALALRDRAATPLGRLDPRFRGDVETIAAKALEKDATRRYQSAADLGADLRRFLAGEPIAARRDSSLYILQKRMRRYRWVLGAAAGFLLLVAGFAVWASASAASFRALAGRERLAKAAESAANAALAGELRTSNLERARLLVASGSSPDGEEILWDEHVRNPSAEDTLWALRDVYAHYPCRATLEGHPAPTEGVAISHDGRVVVSGDRRGGLRVWDGRTGECVRNLPGPPVFARSIALDADAATALVAGADGVLMAWDLATGQKIAMARAHQPGRFSVAISGDGALAATGGADEQVRLWDVRTLAPMGELGVHPGGVQDIVFSPDGSRLAASGNEGVRVWDVGARTSIGPLLVHQGAGGAAFSPDGKTIVSCGGDSAVRLWDVGTMKPAGVIRKGPAWGLRHVTFSADGRRLIFADWWGLYASEAADKAWPELFAVSDSIIAQCALSGDGSTLVSTAGDRIVRLWDVSTDGARRWLEPPRGSRGYLHNAAVTPDGGMIAVVNESGAANLWRASDLTHVGTLPGRKIRLFDVAFSGDGSLLAAGAADGAARVWNVARRELVTEFDAHPGSSLTNVRFSPDGTVLATCGYDKLVKLWNTRDWSFKAEARTGTANTRMVRFTPDGKLMLTTNSAGTLLIMNAGDATVIDTIREEGALWALDISPDGTRFALGDGERRTRIFDLSSRRVLLSLEGHREIVWSVAFSGDGRLLASESSDGMLKVWDASTGACLITVLDDDQGLVFPLSFMPGSYRVLTGHGFRGAAIWDFAYYDRFIAGNAGHHLRRIAGDEPPEMIAAARKWAAGIGR